MTGIYQSLEICRSLKYHSPFAPRVSSRIPTLGFAPMRSKPLISAAESEHGEYLNPIASAIGNKRIVHEEVEWNGMQGKKRMDGEPKKSM